MVNPTPIAFNQKKKIENKKLKNWVQKKKKKKKKN